MYLHLLFHNIEKQEMARFELSPSQSQEDMDKIFGIWIMSCLVQNTPSLETLEIELPLETERTSCSAKIIL